MSLFVETALNIGDRIASEAIWHRGRCSWMAPVAESRRGYPSVSYTSLGADLYAGTAGVALVLAEIFAAAGGDRLRRTSLGAARHALDRASDPDSTQAIGMYSGLLGIVISAIRCGRLLSAPELDEGGRALLRHIRSSNLSSGRYDLMGGRAGAAAAALVISAAVDASAMLEWAVDLGDQILSGAEAGDEGWSWGNAAVASAANLTGLSHGTAGIAHALADLFAVTGEQRFRAGALQAIAYEDGTFDGTTGNWPDFREQQSGPAGQVGPSWPVFWCHGAAGIALSRHSCAHRLGDGWTAAGLAGLRLTAGWSQAAIRTGRGTFCLCHGLAGNAEILWTCADALPEAPALRRLAHEIAVAGVDEFAASGRAWPCGTLGGESPGLMLGLAGIARFYLRLADPMLPSLLMPSRADGAWGL